MRATIDIPRVLKKHRACPPARDFIVSIAGLSPWDAFTACPRRSWQVWFLSHNPRFEHMWEGSYWTLRPDDIFETLLIMLEGRP